MKACPYCAEQIQDAALKCRFCGSTIDVSQASAKNPPSSPSRVRPPTLAVAGVVIVVALATGAAWNAKQSPGRRRALDVLTKCGFETHQWVEIDKKQERTRRELEALLAEQQRLGVVTPDNQRRFDELLDWSKGCLAAVKKYEESGGSVVKDMVDRIR